MSETGNSFATMPDRVDGLCLLCLGAFMAGLASSNLYWYFLNPKFQHLTLAAGVALCLAALPQLLAPREGRWSPAKLARQAALAVFLFLAMSAQNDADRAAVQFVQLRSTTASSAANAGSPATAPGASDSTPQPSPSASGDTTPGADETPPRTLTYEAPATGPITARQAASAPASASKAATPGGTAPEPLPGADETPPSGLSRLGPQSADATHVNLRPVVGGVPYVRLNLAELYIMLDKGRKDYPQHFALRAQVLRSPKLDARGCVLLHRIAVVCCLADSLDLRFVTSGPGVDGLRDGDWVEIYGRLEPLTGADAGLPKLAPRGEGPGLALVNPKFRVTAERIDHLRGIDFPYVFEFREKEPFAW